jgi:MSHA biogenesis protein MshN
MSLLNEMLHDLAKQKPTTQKATLFTTLSPPKRAKSISSILLVCLIVLTISLFFYLINQHKKVKKPSIGKSTIIVKQGSQNVSKETSSVSEATPRISIVAPFVLEETAKQEQPTTKVSYIEPIDSPSSSFMVLDTPEDTNDWGNNQELNDLNEALAEESTVKINKVYTPQTLDEWRNTELNKALKSIDDGFDVEAIAILQKIVEKIPTASDARENLAVLYLYNNDYASAAKIVNEGLKYAPANAALITIKARLSLDQGNADQAVKILSRYKPSIAAYPDYYGTFAAALQSQGRIAEAGSIYKALLQVEPNNGQYWLGYAIALEHNQKANEAIQAYTQASQKTDSDPSVREYAEDRLKTLQG